MVESHGKLLGVLEQRSDLIGVDFSKISMSAVWTTDRKGRGLERRD